MENSLIEVEVYTQIFMRAIAAWISNGTDFYIDLYTEVVCAVIMATLLQTTINEY